jgi:hypothetical protein
MHNGNPHLGCIFINDDKLISDTEHHLAILQGKLLAEVALKLNQDLK